MQKIDKEKMKFVGALRGDTQGNATQSCIKAGWDKDKVKTNGMVSKEKVCSRN